MKRKIAITLFLILSVFITHAQQHTNPIPHPRLKLPAYTHTITGFIGLPGAVGGYIAVSAGLEYERFIDRRGLLSATLSGNAYLGGTIIFGGEFEEGELLSKNYGYFIAPGIRFHPLGNKHSVDIGIGACAALGYGSRRDQFFKSQYPRVYENALIHDFFGAALGELTANFRNQHNAVLFSFFLTGGYIYSNAHSKTYVQDNGNSTYSNNDPGYLQLGLRFGGGW